MSDDLVDKLEAKVHQLIAAAAELRAENQHLSTSQKQLKKENNELRKKNKLAMAKVEGIISRLKTVNHS